MAIIFLPGTIIHEFSHALMAKLLFVYVGRMELMPELHGESLKLGSVEVGRTDIVRNFFIGVAPFVVGVCLLLGILFYAYAYNYIGFNLVTLLILLFTFILSNTMYSSRKDMEGAIEFFLFIVGPIILLYFLGVRIPGLSFSILQNGSIGDFFRIATVLLGVPIILDVAIIVFTKLVVRR